MIMDLTSEAMPFLDIGVIEVILLRLPVRSLCRFKCVSKGWQCLISNHKFPKDHFNHNSKYRKEQLCYVSELNNLFSLDLESPNVKAVQLRFGVGDNPIQFQAVWGSCNGLLLLSDVSFSLYLANPSTGEYRRLPRPLYNDFIQGYGLGYDSTVDDYKVAQVCLETAGSEASENIVSVYSLISNSWRSTERSPHKILLFSCSQGIYTNGALHWLGESDIISLDLASESFYRMPLPGCVGGVEDLDELNIIGGCLCRIVGSADFTASVRVWVLKDYRVKNSWVNYTLDLSSQFIKWMLPSRTGKLLLYDGKTLYVYDLHEEKFEKKAVYFPDDNVPTTWEESLIPLLP